MNYERERMLAEARAKAAVGDGNWRMAAYNLFNASRVTVRMARTADSKTSDSLARLAKRYRMRGDQALARLGSAAEVTRLAEEQPDANTQWFIAERPSVRFSDVAGMDAVKEVVERHVILPVKHPHVYAQYKLSPGAGVLMYGPPGTGKTYMARAIAGEADAAFIPVEMKKVLSKWFGETEHLLGQLFDAARQHPRTVLFIDEAEALFPKRSATNSSVMARIVPQLLQLINGFDPLRNTVVLLGATNQPWLMDEAALRPGRFGRLVYAGPPDAVARAYLFEHAMADVPADALDYARLAERTEGYSGADIAGERDSICVEAKMAALGRTLARSGSAPRPEPVTMADFDAAIGQVKPSINHTDLKRFTEFRTRFEAAQRSTE